MYDISSLTPQQALFISDMHIILIGNMYFLVGDGIILFSYILEDVLTSLRYKYPRNQDSFWTGKYSVDGK